MSPSPSPAEQTGGWVLLTYQLAWLPVISEAAEVRMQSCEIESTLSPLGQLGTVDLLFETEVGFYFFFIFF